MQSTLPATVRPPSWPLVLRSGSKTDYLTFSDCRRAQEFLRACGPGGNVHSDNSTICMFGSAHFRGLFEPRTRLIAGSSDSLITCSTRRRIHTIKTLRTRAGIPPCLLRSCTLVVTLSMSRRPQCRCVDVLESREQCGDGQPSPRKCAGIPEDFHLWKKECRA